MLNRVIVILIAIIVYPPLSFSQQIETDVSKNLSKQTVSIANSIRKKDLKKLTYIGKFKVKPNSRREVTDCNKLIEEAYKIANLKGGNIITVKKTISLKSEFACTIIQGKIYKSDSLHYDLSIKKNSIDDINKKEVSDTLKHAILYVYRPNVFVGSAIGYKLFINDTIVGKVTNGKKFKVILPFEGKIVIHAQTEEKDEVNLEVKYGERYYLKCGLTAGIFVGRPDLKLVDSGMGKREFANSKIKYRQFNTSKNKPQQ